jgi:hypothetical protein
MAEPILSDLAHGTRFSVLNKVSHGLDRLVRPQVRLAHRFWPAYQVCGYTGLGVAIVQSAILTAHQALSLGVLTIMVLLSVLSFYALAMVTKMVCGEERLIYYHHEIAIIIVVATFLWLSDQPLLPYLDITVLAIGSFLGCGRIGCLMVGCCHGKPHHWGVCYRQTHACEGFPYYLVGVRLWPVQAVETLWVLGTVLVGIGLVVSGRPPGEALAWYGMAYGLGRFGLEFLRGDPKRPYLWGLSEAQWTTLLLMLIILWLETAGRLTFHPWHVTATALVAICAAVLVRQIRSPILNRFKIRHPAHIRDVAKAVNRLSKLQPGASLESAAAQPPIRVVKTSLGIQISTGSVRDQGLHHYCLSGPRPDFKDQTVRILADLILQLKPCSGSKEIIRGSRGIYHLLIRPPVAEVSKSGGLSCTG